MKVLIFIFFLTCLNVLPVYEREPNRASGETVSFDWRSDWAVDEGFAVEIDTEGYQFPTAIAFVPNPGRNPQDPLYFVTELRGRVKVVTNDRTVYTFAENFVQFTPKEELPSEQGAGGLAGICLAPEHGYVFVTFIYQDENKILRNNIVRFQSEPDVFSLKPTSQIDFTEIFFPYESGLLHHIGPCQVKDESLYVSLGEAWQPAKAQNNDFLVGKLIRMTLDGKPVPDNPFYQDHDTQKAANYVWASGLRNPFGLKIIGNRIFVADNGSDIDRFLEIRKGENYLWDGHDESIASNADYVIVPSRSPVQMDYYPEGSSIFPETYKQSFFMALSAFKRSKGKIPGVMTIKYGLKESQVLGVPRNFVLYRGSNFQLVTGLGFGPDGLYFSPLMPNQEGRSSVLKVVYNPEHKYPFNLIEDNSAVALIRQKGCLGCHAIDDHQGGTVAPPLYRNALVERLRLRLNSQAYVESLAEVDRLNSEPHRSYRVARQEVLAAEGMDRVRVWMKYRLQEPRFDALYSLMPNLGLSEEESLIITDFFMEEAGSSSIGKRIIRLLPESLRYRHLALAFGSGFLFALPVLLVFNLISRRRR
jgi:glucose/arabinose dehydrogenase